ncbi:MAG TPA: LacI family DNA-binding transcriptional regulator [Chloroflexota bacterium]|nr:LacI family DNA-binding transcriptional regulator [Chloroflexota bacterium]
MAEQVRTGKVTIRDIAASAGVSVATVSRVLNGRPDVKAATRELVLDTIRSHNFSTNRSARGLAGGKTNLVGITLPNLHAEYFALILSGAAETLYDQDVRAVVCPTLHQADREVSLLDRLMHGTTDGSLIVLPESRPELRVLARRHYPFVVVDPKEPLPAGMPGVSAAHFSGARDVMDHLICLGHRRIAAITGPSSWVASIERLHGYQAALAAYGIIAPPEWLVEGNFQIEGGYHAAQVLLALPQRPTAIFAFNDNMAVGALQAIRERGLRVPEDISLVGFDDAQSASLISPPLTTVRQPLIEMGRHAATLLLRLLDGQPAEGLRVHLATQLIVRASTAPPPAED